MDILSLLKKYGFTFSKKYGQNFICDENLLDGIANDASLCKEDTVLEIGAGAGTLTRSLCKRAGRVVSFEIDKTLEPILNETLGEFDNVEVIYDDVTKWSNERLDALTGKNYKVVANLPYYITTPLLFMFLERENPPSSITVMVQKEVAERICANEKKGDYGALSVSVAVRADAEITRIVGREEFLPPPNVDSAIVRITLNGKPPVKDEKTLYSLIKKAFLMKRKTLVNNLSAGYGMSKTQASQLLVSLGFDERVRAEELSKEDFFTLSDAITQLKQ